VFVVLILADEFVHLTLQVLEVYTPVAQLAQLHQFRLETLGVSLARIQVIHQPARLVSLRC